MVSLMRVASLLSLGACEFVPRPSCVPRAAVRNGDRSDLVVEHGKPREEVDGRGGPHTPSWIKDKEIALPVFLNFVSDHRPRVSCVLEDHRHRFCDSYRPAQRILYCLNASPTRRKVVRDPSHHLLSSTVCPDVKRTAVRITQGTYLFGQRAGLLARIWLLVSDGE
jgi:hypothetical protein